MKTTQPEKTIAQVFQEFLADQKARIGHKTYLKYQSIVGLYKSYLESYWPGHDQAEYTGSQKRAAHSAGRSVPKRPLRVTANSSATSCPGK